MPVELIIGLVAIVAWRIIAGMKIPVISAVLRAIWNLSFTVSSFIPFFGWAAYFIIADTEEEKKNKEEMIGVGEAADSLVSDAFGGAASASRFPETIQMGGEQYRLEHASSDTARYYCPRTGESVTIRDTDLPDYD
jgi:hypothetical protein